MKNFTTTVFLAICFWGPGMLQAQSNELQCSLTLKNATFATLISELEANLPLKCYTAEGMEVKQRFSIDARDLSIDSLLSQLLTPAKVGWQWYGDHYLMLYPVPSKKQQQAQSQLTAPRPDAAGSPTQPAAAAVISIGQADNLTDAGNAVLQGYIRDGETGETLVGAQVYAPSEQVGAATNVYGFYTFETPPGTYDLSFSYAGFKDQDFQVQLNGSGSFSVDMFEDITRLDEVTVVANRNQNVASTETGKVQLNISSIKKMPAVLGEVDVVNSMRLLPGISTVGEGSSGFNVRGGHVGQNLITLNQAPVFNSSHLFGMFSIFNPDIVKESTLYRGYIPAKFGGRASAFLDVVTKDGNTKKWAVNGGVGFVASRLTAEGPLSENTSMIVSGRYAYPSYLLDFFEDPQLQASTGNFYDLNGKLTHRFKDNKGQVSLSLYNGEDRFRLGSDTLYQYGNRLATLSISRQLGKQLFFSAHAVFSEYEFEVSQDEDPEIAFETTAEVRHLEGKTDFEYYGLKGHDIRFGLSAIRYRNNPNNISPTEAASEVLPTDIPNEYGWEWAAYLEDEFALSDRVKVSAGLRYSLFMLQGPGQVNNYEAGRPLRSSPIATTTDYEEGENMATYHGPEPRLALTWLLDQEQSVKFSYSRLRQYMQLVTNTAAITPIDVWKLSDRYLQPTISDQLTVGFFKNLRNNTYETSFEVYYRNINNFLDYKNNANLILNPTVETELLQASGTAFGAELMLRKIKGRLTGWLSYSYGRIFLQSDGETVEEQVNNGERYPADFDKPHTFNLVADQQITRRINISGTFTYSTGRPITYPNGFYQVNGVPVANYAERNSYRIPDYHRLDLSMTVSSELRKKDGLGGSWTFSVLNVYGRRNPYSIFFRRDSDTFAPQAYRLSVLGSAFPTVTYNFSF